VTVSFKSKFARAVPLAEMRENGKLQKMVLLRKGSRLSVQPVTKPEFDTICALGAQKQ
jgi:predicted RNA-binding protein with PUA-like domain